jgi:adenylate cyclase
MDYTVIGDSVNLAARLQDLTKTYGEDLIVDQATATAVETTVDLRQIDMVAVRGRVRQETIFGLSREPAGTGIVG